MSCGPTQNPKLTRAQRKVLADLLLFRDSHNVTEISHRKLAETTGLPFSTVRSILNRFNDLELIWTFGGNCAWTSRHVILRQVPVVQDPVRSLAAKAGRS